MTLRNQELDSLLRAHGFLQDLLDSKKTPGVPRRIRKAAWACFHHYPPEWRVKELFDAEGKTREPAVDRPGLMLCGHERTECTEGGCCMGCVKGNAARPYKDALERALELLKAWDDWSFDANMSPPPDVLEGTRNIFKERGNG